MKKLNYICILLLLLWSIGCSSDSANEQDTNDLESEELYFPPIGSDDWERISVEELNWNEDEVQPLLDYLESKDTKAFLILKNGKIVLESYFNGSDASENNAWNSTGKT